MNKLPEKAAEESMSPPLSVVPLRDFYWENTHRGRYYHISLQRDFWGWRVVACWGGAR